MIKFILLAVLLGLFSGCSIKDVTKPIVKYTIEDTSQIIKETNQVNKILKISKLKSPKYIQTNNIWYKKPSFEVSSYLYSRWNQDFTHLIEKNISNSIYRSRLFKSMFTRHSKMKSDLILEGEIIDAKQVVDSTGISSTVLSIRLYLIKSNDSSIISTKEFNYSETDRKTNASSAIVAFNVMVKKLNKDVVLWLKKSTI